MRGLRTDLLLFSLLLLGCGSGPTVPGPGDGFEDHTRPTFDNGAAFLEFAGSEQQPAQLKFVLSTFQEASGPASFLDPRFYTLHDEWYWFQMLNGVAIEGVDEEPAEGPTYSTISEIYEAMSDVEELPLGMRWTDDGRLYAPRFYDLSLGREWDEESHAWVDVLRELGAGSVLHYAADPARALPEELWLFELEYVDKPDEALLLQFRSRLQAALPEDVASQLRWLARPSASQRALAETLRAGDGPLAELVVTYQDLVVAGQNVPYNTGIVAGKVRIFTAGTLGGASVSADEIIVTEDVPDYLPPVAAIVTAVPQTPLAHLNLLAKARGTPNVHVGGVMSDPQLADWAHFGTPVILEVTPSGARWTAITNSEYLQYRAKLGHRELAVEQIDLKEAPYFVDLELGEMGAMADLVPLTGGKSAGFLGLQSLPEVEVPYRPLAITIRAYHEHVASFASMIQQLLANPTFMADPRVRYVVLEGPDDFRKEHAGDPEALDWLDAFLASHGNDPWLGNLIQADGFKAVLRAKPLGAAFKTALIQTLEERYGALAITQGLRLRSSSTAEDIEGFNGAGLYDSNTGFLHPEAQVDPKYQDRTIEWALLKTWASYWTFEAFEERQAAGIDHLSGNMGVLVHPRFDDPQELANGVMTFTLSIPDGTAPVSELVLNVQDGALSVTNPEPGNPAEPEIDRVRRELDGGLAVERVQASTEVSPGTWVFEETELSSLFSQAEGIALWWLDMTNALLPPEQRRTSVVLDFEVKHMAAGWPAFADGTVLPQRVVLKQARTLESPLTITQYELGDVLVPRDLLAATIRVQERICGAPKDGLQLRVVELFTTADAPLFDHAELPFAASMELVFTSSVPEFDVAIGQVLTATHAELAGVTRPGMPEQGWALALELLPAKAEALGFTTLSVEAGGPWSVEHYGATHNGGNVECKVQDLVVGPSEYLHQLLAEKAGE